jgi:hypothetical protein
MAETLREFAIEGARARIRELQAEITRVEGWIKAQQGGRISRAGSTKVTNGSGSGSGNPTHTGAYWTPERRAQASRRMRKFQRLRKAAQAAQALSIDSAAAAAEGEGQ